MAAWLIEAYTLAPHDHALTIHFTAPFDTTQLVWNKLKSMAAFYDAALQCARDEKPPFQTQKDLIMASVDDKGCHADPEAMVTTVRWILSGTSMVRMDCVIGTLEEFDEEVRMVAEVLEGKGEKEWEKYRKSIVEGKMEEPESGLRRMMEVYADYPPE